MDLQIEDFEKIFDQYEELLSEIGIEYLGDVYSSDGIVSIRVPLFINDGEYYIDWCTHKDIEEKGLDQENLLVIGRRLYNKTEYIDREKSAEDNVSFPDYIKDMYYSELLTIASKKMHAAYPKDVERVWSEIGKRFKLNERQSQCLRIVCYQPKFANYEIENDSDEDVDEDEEIKKCNLLPLLKDLQEYSKHCFCDFENCKVGASQIERCRELHKLFDNEWKESFASKQKK